ncbi:hypothetical protein Acsp01_14120 [Actinoplanes sp. NBRC 101535]|nr:hypothetical protein Acsp01_14120 [Actinoplanes sp. NBRC 101535]
MHPYGTRSCRGSGGKIRKSRSEATGREWLKRGKLRPGREWLRWGKLRPGREWLRRGKYQPTRSGS